MLSFKPCLAAFYFSAAAFAAAAPQRLFPDGLDPAQALLTDARAEATAMAGLRITTGHQHPWPGVSLPAPNGTWDLSRQRQVVLSVRNAGASSVNVICRADNHGADGRKHCVTGSVTIAPGETQELRVELKRTQPAKLGGKLFGMRGYPVEQGTDGAVDPARISQLVIFTNKSAVEHMFEIDDIRAEGTFVAPTASVSDADPYFPFIDSFGQYRHRDWPGKIHSQDELEQRRATEERELSERPAPPDWDMFGGWAAGPKLDATGFFRTQKHAGKWWLVDPEGRLFFSQGIDSVRMHDATPIDEREAWFEQFPGAQPEFREFLSSHYALKGHYADRSPRCFSFAGANLKRKYGNEWRRIVPERIHRRLRSWGINTMGNWSDESTRLLRRTPYVDSITSSKARRIEGSDGYWGKFPDVFDPTFRETLARSVASYRGKSAADPWCIGFFSDNEMAWGDELSLALATLQSPPEQAAKKAFLAELRERHGDIAKLNAAWGTTHASWDALLACRTAPDKAKARTDLEAFYSRIAETYFRVVRAVIKEAAPQQLYLGCRFAWTNPRAAVAAAKFCDVVSFNLYQRSVADFQFPGVADVPLIIGEFHFGALDRGLFHTGLVPTGSQAERATAYRDYVFGALRHPQFVGCHWFQYQDEPATGRVYDEENYQIGFVDVADTPYPEMVNVSRELAAAMYRGRFGR